MQGVFTFVGGLGFLFQISLLTLTCVDCISVFITFDIPFLQWNRSSAHVQMYGFVAVLVFYNVYIALSGRKNSRAYECIMS